MSIPLETLDFMINHVILPPKLPQETDSNAKLEIALINFIYSQALVFQENVAMKWKPCWARITKMLKSWVKVAEHGSISKEALVQVMNTLAEEESIALDVKCQNAGIILRKVADGVIFECFEVSATAKAVMNSRTCLRRKFPGHAIQLPYKTFHNPKFSNEFASFLQRLDMEQVDEVMPKSRKGNSEVVETRESSHPRLVTELLMAILAPYGQPIKVCNIEKRTRDDVCLNNARLPWRRSSVWITLKIAIQLALVNAGLDDSHLQYKNFMIFAIAEISRLGRLKRLPLDLLFVINAKAARRASKLAGKMFDFVEIFTISSVKDCKVQMEKRVLVTRRADSTEVRTVLSSFADTALSLNTSKTYLGNVLNRCLGRIDRNEFSASAPSRLSGSHKTLPLPGSLNVPEKHLMLTLVDFESWVRDKLKLWLLKPENKNLQSSGWLEISEEAHSRHSSDDCQSLKMLIDSYKSSAIQKYSLDSENLSLMLLTILELWCALDIIALGLHPLLEQYSPEIPSSILQPLLLPRREELIRIQHIERYLEQRHQRATKNLPSMFGTITNQSFSVQYFNSSHELQKLRQEIEDNASRDKEAKLEELAHKNARYSSLIEQANRLQHLMKINRRGISYHDYSCAKCGLENEAKRIYILVHEWPLPASNVQAKAAVFELSCPGAITAWRDVTFKIIHDLGRRDTINGRNVEEQIHLYLKQYYKSGNPRITVGSTAKSFLRAHYNKPQIPVDAKKVTLNNGLIYQVLDTAGNSWTSEQSAVPTFDYWCISNLPKGPYSNLQRTVDSPRHTQNEVLADQISCSTSITLHEFHAFGSLRAGERLQWYNIIRELVSSNLDLNADAVGILFTQAAWQVGSPLLENLLRESHAVFGDLDFCKRMHEVLSRAVQNIEASWKELTLMSLLTILTLRLLSLTVEKLIIEQALQLLSRIRRATLHWTQELARKMQDQRKSCGNSQFQNKLLKSALTCRMTYFVDSRHVDLVLQSSIDIAMFIELSIIAHDITPDDVSQLPLLLQHALARDQRLAQLLEPKIAQLVRQGFSGLSEGILNIWHGARLGDSWEFMKAPLERWVFANTTPFGGSLSQLVHYNLLSGELLVDGRRLGRLPSTFTGGELYKRIFGAAVLDVVAADEIGMSYQTTRLISDYRVYFGTLNGDLLIRIKNNHHFLEAIPSQYLEGDVPANFVTDCVHWLDLNTGEIEFRPWAELWLPKIKNWRLSFRSEPQILYQPHRTLIDPRSSTCNQIKQIFKPIEDEQFIEVVLSDDAEILVELPRFSIGFFVNKKGQLECPELHAVVDQNQAIGTFCGLKSRLVLHGVGKLSSHTRRSILVPYGSISMHREVDLTEVFVNPGTTKTVRYFIFQLEQRLRQVRSGPDLMAQFYRTYLHAVTSQVLPDPFTGRTGVEEAVSCLVETRARSCTALSEGVLELLNMIASLTPARDFYPPYLKCIQKTQWNPNLSPLVQHAKFYELAEHIIYYNNRFMGLYEGEAKRSLKSRGSEFLHQRASRRSLGFYPRTVQDLTVGEAVDLEYISRDHDEKTESAKRSFEFADLIQRWPSKLEVDDDIYTYLMKWQTVDGFGQPFEVQSISELLDIPFSSLWGSLYSHCRYCSSDNIFSLSFLFCTISYGNGVSAKELRSLLAFAFTDTTRLPKMPPSGAYELWKGYRPQRSVISDIVQENAYEFKNTGSATEIQEAARVYQNEVKRQSTNVINEIIRHWPQAHPPAFFQTHAPLINVQAVTIAMESNFSVWFRNYSLFRHFEDVKPILREMNQLKPQGPILIDFRLDREFSKPTIKINPIPGLDQLLENPLDLPVTQKVILQFSGSDEPILENDNEFVELQSIITECSSRSDATRTEYGYELLKSLQALKIANLSYAMNEISCSIDTLITYQRMAELHERNCYKAIFDKLQPKPGRAAESLLLEAGIWPLATPRELLSRLSHVHISKLHDSWKRALLAYAEGITNHQKAIRLLSFAEAGNIRAFHQEISNQKNDGWSPDEQPDWRLMEIENDFLIRPIQAKVAKEMIAPSKGNKNFVMQLNMGEGKSSVIIPMLACALADGRKLVRCVVLKPLARQMGHVLSQRLGGIVGRCIYYAPFSRKTKSIDNIAAHLDEIYRECRDFRGVLLIQPEHILSFKLMGIDRLYARASSSAIAMINTQIWLEQNSRDILDESDELLHVNFELAYTIGTQMGLDGQPARWTVVQSLFSLIDKHAHFLHARFPKGIEWIFRGNGSFPTCRILDVDVGVRLIAGLVESLLGGLVAGVSFGHCDELTRGIISEFIGHPVPSSRVVQKVLQIFKDTVQIKVIFLLRGLLAHGILLFSLQRKRWLVNYGLDPKRCLMAVPYRAKSVPSVSAEFAHPDVAIVLTCLSYYYTGLTKVQLRTCFNHLDKMTDPSLEYHEWQRDSKLPAELRNFSGVNLEDENQWNLLIFPHLRLNKNAIDFFLARIVFPNEGKEFAYKLSASAWDLPADCKYAMTTGFSGTNDNRLLLPLNIHQQDLAELKHTSAMVLNILLRKENRRYVAASDENEQRISVKQLLFMLVSERPSVRVLLDVGAQVLEIGNREVIEEWLLLAPDVKAGIFFDLNDELMVVDREGKLERLLASSFRERLGDCVVYLDEAHTRGTDLGFPTTYRAAVMLGPELTKDRFVQACMRMRKLGHGQSVVCFAPPEVNRSIMSLVQKPSHEIEISDVIRWTLERTCCHVERERALWVTRGVNYTKRRLAHDLLLQAAGSEDATAIAKCDGVDKYLDCVKDREAMSLKEMYVDPQDERADLPAGLKDNLNDPIAQALAVEWRKLDAAVERNSTLQEEQEREVAHEIEQERQVERPREIEPRIHNIHAAVRAFVRTGVLPEKNDGFRSLFNILQHTSAKDYNIPSLDIRAFASEDFVHAVRATPYDDYLRPVNWILVGKGKGVAEVLLLSPFEANELLPAIRQSRNVVLHVYAPRSSKAMLSFSRLDFLSIPSPSPFTVDPRTLSALNLFAGALYFESAREYRDLCDFCGLVGGTTQLPPNCQVSSEGFVLPASREAVMWSCPFMTSPLPLIQALLNMRRKGEVWSATHMGQIVDGKILRDCAF